VNSASHIRFYKPEDRPALEALYQAVYGGEAWHDHTRLGWYIDQPLAEAGSSVAVMGDKIVAAQPFCDFPLHTPWGVVRATLFLDVATHPEYRRQGLFWRVVAAARTAAFERGACLALTTPNRMAFQGFQRMPEWRQLCTLDCLLVPIGAGARTRSAGISVLGARLGFAAASVFWHGPRPRAPQAGPVPYTIESPWVPGPEAEALWRSVAARTGIIVQRDRAFLHWRFDAGCRLFLARAAHGPVGYAAARIITRAGLKLGMLLDCVTAGDGAHAVPLLAAVLAWLREQGAAAALGYFVRYSTPWHQARAAGFVCLPRPVVPRDYPVCASVRPDDPHSLELLNPAHWYMSLADSDLA
jgi:GNAT superfamily N-acetyltransferase